MSAKAKDGLSLTPSPTKATIFENLKVKKVKANTRGTPVTGYIFTWKPEKTGKWVENKYDIDSWTEKQLKDSPGSSDPVPMINWLEDLNE